MRGRLSHLRRFELARVKPNYASIQIKSARWLAALTACKSNQELNNCLDTELRLLK